MDKLTDEERAALKDLLAKGVRTEPKNEVGIGFGSFKFWVKEINFVTFLFMIYIFVSTYMFLDFKREAAYAHKIIQEGQAEQTFLMTLTPEQRAALGIEMPESLKRKIYNPQDHERELSRRYR